MIGFKGGTNNTPCGAFTYTATGRYLKLGTSIIFYYYLKTSGSNPIDFGVGANVAVDLPPPATDFYVSAIGSLQKVGNTDPSQIRSMTGTASPTDTRLFVYPSNAYQWNGTNNIITGIRDMILTNAFEFWLSGNYESSDV
jgi:hypothetical protein